MRRSPAAQAGRESSLDQAPTKRPKSWTWRQASRSLTGEKNRSLRAASDAQPKQISDAR